MDTRKELFVTDLASVFEPRSLISENSSNSVWRALPYKANAFSGVMLTSLGTGRPEDISFDPKLTGWYKIYIQTIGIGDLRLHLKLSSDVSYEEIEGNGGNYCRIDETLWRYADMTGETITLSKKRFAINTNSVLSGLHFVPMTDEEVAAYKADAARTDTKRLFATHDMHGKLYGNYLSNPSDWLSLVLPYKNSDVEWLSLEEIRIFLQGKCPSDPDDFPFQREGDRSIQKQITDLDYDKALADCVRYGHEIGLKMSISLRMGAWGMGFPYDQCYFDVPFHDEHPELHCVDRNGDNISAMSYAFPEVRKFVIDTLINSARSGCDAVTLIAHRGIPYVLFEKPVADRYFELYGEYPYALPLNNPRLNAIHCDIMTGFFRELREALDLEFGKDKIRIQLRALHTLSDDKLIGLDAERLAAEGLVDDFIVYPKRFDELWKMDGVLNFDEGKGEERIDLEKYNEYVHGGGESLLHSHGYSVYDDIYAQMDGWNALEKKYGVKIYYEIMPRIMPSADFKKRALELYSRGAERFALWDTYCRVPYNDLRAMISKLGHKDELPTLDPEGCKKKHYRILSFGNMNFGRYKPYWGG